MGRLRSTARLGDWEEWSGASAWQPGCALGSQETLGQTDGQERGANHKHPRAAWPVVNDLIRGHELGQVGCCWHQVCKTVAGLKRAPENSVKIHAFQVLCVSHSVVSNSVQPHGLYPIRLLHPWNSPGKNTGVGSHFLLQGIFPTQGSNSGLLYCRQILYWLGCEGRLQDLSWGHINFLSSTVDNAKEKMRTPRFNKQWKYHFFK